MAGRPGKPILYLAIGLYALIIGSLSLWRYASYQAGMFDLGIMEQALWNTSHGRILTESVNMGYPISRMWSSRWELIYLPIALIHRVFPYPATGLVIQTLCLALGAIPLYRLARDRLGEGPLTTVIPILYLLYPPMHNANLFDIHGITFAMPLFLFAFYFLHRGEMVRFSVFTVLLLMCREDASFLVFMLGLFAIFVEKRRGIGLLFVLVSIGWFFLIQNVRYFRSWFDLPPVYDPSMVPSRWAHLGDSSPGSFILTLLSHPLPFLRSFWNLDNLKLLVKLFGPFLLLPLFSPSTLALMLPNLVINMTSNSPLVKNVYHHYAAAITPAIAVSLVYGIGNLRRLCGGHPPDSFRGRLASILSDRLLILVLLVPMIVAFTLWSTVLRIERRPIGAHGRAIEEALATVPGDASLSAHFLIAPHVADRESLYLFPDGLEVVRYVVYDLGLPYTRLMTQMSQSKPAVPPVNGPLLDLLQNPSFGVVTARDGVIVLRRGADYRTGVECLSRPEGVQFDGPLSGAKAGALRLSGVHPEGVVGYDGELYHLVLSWTLAEKEGGAGPMRFLLEGDGGRRETLHEPLFGLLDRLAWHEGRTIRDDLFLSIQGLLPGEYLLSLAAGEGLPGRPITHPIVFLKVGQAG